VFSAAINRVKEMNYIGKQRVALLLVALAAGLAIGCRAPKESGFKPSKFFSLNSSWPWRDADEPQQGTPVRIVGTWTDTVLTQPGQKPQRGFGGRLVFYEKDNDEPILVDGQLVVYAFDETGRAATDNKPTRRYVFPADQVPQHMSLSELGASYSFWLPWDEAGGPKTEVSLICRFEPKDGAVVTSEQTRHLLPGSLAPPSAAVAGQPPPLPEGVPSRPARPSLEALREQPPANQGAQRASYESAADSQPQVSQASSECAAATPERRMSVTSIRLPDNFDLRTAAANARVIAAPVLSQPQVPVPAPAQSVYQHRGLTIAQPAGTSPPGPAAVAPAGSARQTMPGIMQGTMPGTQTAPGTGFGAVYLPRPQLATPQWFTVPPVLPAGASAPNVSLPAQSQQPAQPAAR
jgi:hypothetical protein